jgi:hypothetical protein
MDRKKETRSPVWLGVLQSTRIACQASSSFRRSHGRREMEVSRFPRSSKQLISSAWPIFIAAAGARYPIGPGRKIPSPLRMTPTLLRGSSTSALGIVEISLTTLDPNQVFGSNSREISLQGPRECVSSLPPEATASWVSAIAHLPGTWASSSSALYTPD